MRRTVHFIYYLPPARNALMRTYNRFCENTGLLSPLYRNGGKFFCNWPNPVYAPFSITYYLHKALEKKYNVKLYSNWERGVCNLKPGDIMLAHPDPDNSASGTPEDPWIKCNKESITWRSLERYPGAESILILPFTHQAHQTGWLNEIFDQYTKKFIAICGDYWTVDWKNSPYGNNKCEL